MDYFNDVYLRRLNRYGLDYQSRLQNKREENFENLLLKSIYRVDFDYQDKTHPGIFERYKQDNTETLHYLLTRVNLNLPNGTILMIPNKDGELKPWLVYWLEEIVASGYNRYVMLRMTHNISWIARDGSSQTSWVYMYGQENNMLKDELKSRSRSNVIYNENLKLSFFVMPLNKYIRKDDYLEIGEGTLKEAYVVTGYDIQSTPGVEFVSVDPVYIRDNSAPPEQTSEDNKEDFFWLNKGE